MLLRVKEQRNILHEIRKRKANWIGHILRRNCLLQQVIEGKIKGQIEVTRRRGRWRKKLLDDLKGRRGYCQLKEDALDRTMWRIRFGRGFGPVVWQITDDDDDDDDDDDETRRSPRRASFNAPCARIPACFTTGNIVPYMGSSTLALSNLSFTVLKYSRTQLIRIGLALLVNLSRIL